MKLGIVGLPNVGKSTLFNAITNAGVAADNYAFCTIDPNVGVVSVPDKRLEWLRDQHNPKKFTPAVIEFVDIAGLVKGASRGEGLGNKFLANIRGCDAIVHVVRCFDDANVTHVEGSTDPLRDIDIINTELIMADLEMIDRRIDKAQKNAKGGDKRFNHEVEVFTALRDYMNEGNLARTFECSEDDAAMIATSDLLTLRKTIYAANLSENDVNQPEACKYFTQVQELAAKEGSEVLPICAKLEADIAELDDPDEKAMFMEELGLQQSGLDRLIQCSYELLGLISFLTAGADECRAWTIKKGTRLYPRRGHCLRRSQGLRHTGQRKGKGLAPQRGQGIRHARRRRRELPVQRVSSRPQQHPNGFPLRGSRLKYARTCRFSTIPQIRDGISFCSIDSLH